MDEEDCRFEWGVAVCLRGLGVGFREVVHVESLSVQLQE
jgi:hypothetical protein